MTTLTVGCIGAGDIAAKVHLPVLLATSGVRVAWIADRDSRRAERVGRAFGVVSVPIDAGLAALPAADVLVVAVPYGAREPYVALGKERGSAVYLEKPIARTLAEHDRLLADFPSQRIGHGFQRRAAPAVRLARALVGEAAFGSLERIEYALGARASAIGGGFRTDVRMSGGGLLLESGIHGVDAALHIASATDCHVVAADVRDINGFEVHARLSARLSTPMGDVDAAFHVTTLDDPAPGMTLRFEHATVQFSIYDTGNAVRVTTRRGGSERTLSSSEPPVTIYQLFHRHWTRFLDGIHAGLPNETSVRDSRLTTRIVEAALLAARPLEIR